MTYSGARLRAEPTVSNSAPRSSPGNVSAGVSVVPSRSATVLLYSGRLRRRTTMYPGLCGAVAGTVMGPGPVPVGAAAPLAPAAAFPAPDPVVEPAFEGGPLG